MTQRTQCFEWAHRAGPPTHHFAVHCLHLVSFLWFPQSPPDQTQCLANLSQSVLPWLRPATFPPTKMSHVLYMCSVGSMHMYMHAWSIYVSICTYICAAAQPTSHAGQDPCVQYSTGSGVLACLHGMPGVYHIGWPTNVQASSKQVCLSGLLDTLSEFILTPRFSPSLSPKCCCCSCALACLLSSVCLNWISSLKKGPLGDIPSCFPPPQPEGPRLSPHPGLSTHNSKIYS